MSYEISLAAIALVAACNELSPIVPNERDMASAPDLLLLDGIRIADAPGTIMIGQSFNETRGVSVTPKRRLTVRAMALDGLRVGPDGRATVGARIYDEAATLLAHADTTVTSDGRVTLALDATLAAGTRYRLAFFCGPDSPLEDNSGDLFKPSALAYTEASGALTIDGAWQSPLDAYPDQWNLGFPQIVLVAH